MEAIFTQIKEFISTANDEAKTSIISQLHTLAYSLENADDTAIRIGHTPLQIAVVRIGIDLKIFDLLSASESPLTLDEIVKSTGGSPQLLARLLRYLASIATIKETGKNTFTASNVTRNLADPSAQAGICHNFHTSGPTYQHMPQYLKEVGYQNPADHSHTVIQETYNFEGTVYTWLNSHSENMGYFQAYLKGRRQMVQDTWLSVYPVEAETEGLDPETPVLVDIGGSIGENCAQFKQLYPNIPGRVILQDLAGTIASASSTPGVENMAHDFFEEQPIKGAKYYYLAHILHNWPDEKCREILRHTKAAMGKDSVILIDEMVLPDTAVPANMTAIDMEMLCCLASVEHTQSEWNELLATEGLKCVKTWVYRPKTCESVMHVVPI